MHRVEIVRLYSADGAQVIVGRHEDHGQTVLIRNGGTITAIVDEPGFFEMRRGQDKAAAAGAALARAVRAGKNR